MFGIYVHIPFCLQRCHYCDFATYSQDQIAVNSNYVDHLLLEIKKRRNLVRENSIDSIYFGGGTPSLLSPEEIKRIIDTFTQEGFQFSPKIEITLEVNPATLDKGKLAGMIDAGINRLSVGSQTFDDSLLQLCGRKHNSKDTLETMSLIKARAINYSLDLLFALPKQDMKGLQRDLKVIKEIDPPHVSAYCLTVPSKHPMNKGREPEGEQVKMFQEIKNSLSLQGLKRYEISNFARPGFESVHNMIYWQDENYWGVGLSAHSYMKDEKWGYRFWNASDYKQYLKQITDLSVAQDWSDSFPSTQIESLQTHQSLTDYCHTALRTSHGISKDGAHQKYGSQLFTKLQKRISPLVKNQLVREDDQFWSLTERGVLLSNQVFADLLFRDIDIGP